MRVCVFWLSKLCQADQEEAEEKAEAEARRLKAEQAALLKAEEEEAKKKEELAKAVKEGKTEAKEEPAAARRIAQLLAANGGRTAERTAHLLDVLGVAPAPVAKRRTRRASSTFAVAGSSQA